MEVIKMTRMLPSYFYDKWRKPNFTRDMEEDIRGKRVLITGGDGGLGREAVIQLAERGAKVVMASLTSELGQDAVTYIRGKTSKGELIILPGLDLSDLKSVRNFADKVISEGHEFDIVILNAGIFRSYTLDKTKDGFENHFGINYLGHFLLCNLLLPRIKAPGRIIFTASGMHILSKFDLDNLNLDGFKRNQLGGIGEVPYANSKLALMYFSAELAERIKDSGVATFALCPGLVDTGLFDDCTRWTRAVKNFMLISGGLSPEKACEIIVFCAVAKGIEEHSGKMIRFNRVWDGPTRELEAATELRKKLYDLSLKMVGLV